MTEDDADLLAMDPQETYNPCIVGIARRFDTEFLVYDQACILATILAELDLGDEDDPEDAALEWFHFNVLGAWLGDGTPAFMRPYPDPEEL